MSVEYRKPSIAEYWGSSVANVRDLQIGVVEESAVPDVAPLYNAIAKGQEAKGIRTKTGMVTAAAVGGSAAILTGLKAVGVEPPLEAFPAVAQLISFNPDALATTAFALNSGAIGLAAAARGFEAVKRNLGQTADRQSSADGGVVPDQSQTGQMNAPGSSKSCEPGDFTLGEIFGGPSLCKAWEKLNYPLPPGAVVQENFSTAGRLNRATLLPELKPALVRYGNEQLFLGAMNENLLGNLFAKIPPGELSSAKVLTVLAGKGILAQDIVLAYRNGLILHPVAYITDQGEAVWGWGTNPTEHNGQKDRILIFDGQGRVINFSRADVGGRKTPEANKSKGQSLPAEVSGFVGSEPTRVAAVAPASPTAPKPTETVKPPTKTRTPTKAAPTPKPTARPTVRPTVAPTEAAKGLLDETYPLEIRNKPTAENIRKYIESREAGANLFEPGKGFRSQIDEGGRYFYADPINNGTAYFFNFDDESGKMLKARSVPLQGGQQMKVYWQMVSGQTTMIFGLSANGKLGAARCSGNYNHVCEP